MQNCGFISNHLSRNLRINLEIVKIAYAAWTLFDEVLHVVYLLAVSFSWFIGFDEYFYGKWMKLFFSGIMFRVQSNFHGKNFLYEKTKINSTFNASAWYIKLIPSMWWLMNRLSNPLKLFFHFNFPASDAWLKVFIGTFETISVFPKKWTNSYFVRFFWNLLI